MLSFGDPDTNGANGNIAQWFSKHTNALTEGGGNIK